MRPSLGLMLTRLMVFGRFGWFWPSARDLAGMMLLEVLRQNYGIAKDYSSQYFEKLRETSEQVDNSTLKTSPQELLNSRDMVTAALSKADPASASQLQAIFAKTQPVTKAQP